jgi:hypothetical protein
VGIFTANSSGIIPVVNNFCWATPSGVLLYSMAVLRRASFVLSEAGRLVLAQLWEQWIPLFLCLTWHFGQTFSLYIFGILRYPLPDDLLPDLFTTYTQSYTQGFTLFINITFLFSPVGFTNSSFNSSLLFHFIEEDLCGGRPEVCPMHTQLSALYTAPL